MYIMLVLVAIFMSTFRILGWNNFPFKGQQGKGLETVKIHESQVNRATREAAAHRGVETRAVQQEGSAMGLLDIMQKITARYPGGHTDAAGLAGLGISDAEHETAFCFS